jgi:CRISPR-associated protein Csm5
MHEVGRFRLLPLTPIHVGDGNELDPTSYLITPSGGSGPDRLARFDPVATISKLGTRDRRDYDRALRTGDLAGGQQILQRSAARGETIPVALVSDESARELRAALSNPEQSGRFGTMVRSGGTPILPGSTLKGAFRTGLLHIETERLDSATRSRLLAAIEVPGRSGAASDRLQEAAFTRPRAQTERDPMRDVSVADAALLEGATVIDRVVDWRRGPDREFGPAEQMFQLHVERCVCLADAGRFGDVALASVEVTLTAEAVRRRRLETHGRDVPAPARSPHLAELVRGLNEHHLGVWHLEREHFFSGRRSRETTSLLDACLGALGLRDVDEIGGKPGWALLRLGWAGHFEAKSIAAVRQGFRPQSRDAKTAKVGSTRHGVILGGVFVPFGWALLVPEEEAPATLPRVAGAAAAPRPASPVSAGPVRAPAGVSPAPGSLFFRRGERVRNDAGEIAVVTSDVRVGDGDMTIEIEGDLETVRVGEWRRV